MIRFFFFNRNNGILVTSLEVKLYILILKKSNTFWQPVSFLFFGQSKKKLLNVYLVFTLWFIGNNRSCFIFRYK